MGQPDAQERHECDEGGPEEPGECVGGRVHEAFRPVARDAPRLAEAYRVEAEQDERRGALDLNRAVEVVAHGIGRPVG